MKIGIANDHGGVELKFAVIEYLQSKGYEVVNFGSDTLDRVDFPIYAFKLGEALRDKSIDYGIAICKSAIGMSVACNKVKGVRCAAVYNMEDAKHAKRNDYINIIALSGENISTVDNIKIVEAFLNEENGDDPAYANRRDQIVSYENAH